MKILVCVKQVADSPETLVITDNPPGLSGTDATVYRLNRYDEFALEEALLIRERFVGTVIHVLSIGPDRVRQSIRKALEMGADDGIHIRFDSGAYLSPAVRASLIAGYAAGRGYDLILTGIMAEDDMECQVGQILAERMDLPYATSVIRQDIRYGENSIYVEREIEGGALECLMLTLPALVSVQSGINTPRYPALSHVLRARKQAISCIEPSEGEVMEENVTVTDLRYPETKITGEFIEGPSVVKARTLLGILHEHSVL